MNTAPLARDRLGAGLTSVRQVGRRWRPGQRYVFTVVALGIIAIVFAGFAHSYYVGVLMGSRSLSPLLHLHGAVMTLWFVLFLAQSVLVAAHRVDWHKSLGFFGVAVAGAVLGIGMVVAMMSVHADPSPSALVFLVVPLGDLSVFAILCAFAIRFRTRGAVHKRLMLLASVGLLPAAFARIPVTALQSMGPRSYFWDTDVVVLLCIVYDTMVSRRLHPAFLWGGLFVVLSQPLRIILAHTHLWGHVASWLAR